MEKLRELLENEYFTKENRVSKYSEIKLSFPEFLQFVELNEFHLMLFPFCNETPLKYCNKDTIKVIFDYLINDTHNAIKAFNLFENEISHSITSLLRKGSSWNKEYDINLSKVKDYEEFETVWQPEYIRYVENILNHLIKIPLHLISSSNGKNYLELTLSNKIEILKNNDLELLTIGYSSLIRNAISHGTYQYGIRNIKYIDKNGIKYKKEDIYINDFAIKFDELVQTCNSILIGYCLFVSYLKNNQKMNELPNCFLFLFMKGYFDFEDFEIVNMIKTSVHISKNQIILNIKTNSKYRFDHLLYSLIISYTLYRANLKNINRIGFEIDFGLKLQSQVFINYDAFIHAIKSDILISDKFSFIEETLNWYDNSFKIPKWRNRIRLLKSIKTKAQGILLKEWTSRGVYLLSKNYIIKEIKNSSTDKKIRIHVYAVLKNVDLSDFKQLGYIIKKIINEINRSKYYKKKLGKHIGIKHFPNYIWIYLYKNDSSIRILKSQSWEELNHIMNIEWIDKVKKNPRILIKKPDFVNKNLSIYFNPNLKEIFNME